MKRLILAVLLTFLLLTAAWADEDVLYVNFQYRGFDVYQSSDSKRTPRLLPNGEEVQYCQGKDSTVLLVGMSDTYVGIFRTRDKKLSFPGNIKIGGDINEVIKSGQVPGKYSNEADRVQGRIIHTWKNSEQDVIIVTVENKIVEVTYQETAMIKEIGVVVEPNFLEFLSDASGAPAQEEDFLDGIWGIVFDFKESGKILKTSFTDFAGKRITQKDAEKSRKNYLIYAQGEDTVSITLVDAEKIVFKDSQGFPIALVTRDKDWTFTNGVKIGDPISKILAPGVVNGNVSRPYQNSYKWTFDGGPVLSVTEKDGRIFEIAYWVDMQQYPSFSFKIDGGLLEYVKAPAGASAKQTPPPKPAQPAAKAQQPEQKKQPEQKSEANTSTDSKVINSYPLSTKDKNALSIQHRAAYNAYSKKSYKKAFEAFSKLADEYEGNYLSAYWAAESAMRLGKKNDAKTWYDKALAINPNYKPAADARGKLK